MNEFNPLTSQSKRRSDASSLAQLLRRPPRRPVSSLLFFLSLILCPPHLDPIGSCRLLLAQLLRAPPRPSLLPPSPSLPRSQHTHAARTNTRSPSPGSGECGWPSRPRHAQTHFPAAAPTSEIGPAPRPPTHLLRPTLPHPTHRASYICLSNYLSIHPSHLQSDGEEDLVKTCPPSPPPLPSP